MKKTSDFTTKPLAFHEIFILFSMNRTDFSPNKFPLVKINQAKDGHRSERDAKRRFQNDTNE